MSNLTILSADRNVTVKFSDTGLTDTKVIDLTNNHIVTRGASKPTECEGAWAWALVNAPHTLTLKAKLRIFDNLFNQRSAFNGVGRIPNVALAAYREAHKPAPVSLEKL